MSEEALEGTSWAIQAAARLAEARQQLKESDDKNQLQQAMYDIAEAMQYPMDNHGRRYDLRYLSPMLSYHLARAGIGKVEGQAVIKKRKLPPSPGVFDDAIEWVPLDAPSSIDDELAGRRLDDLSGLSKAARAEAIRRLGGDGAAANPEPDMSQTPWHVQTSIHLDGLDDGDNSPS